jgi:hypothetical protein
MLVSKRYMLYFLNFADACGVVGRGITDQDRNILSNQILILGFLGSAANLLTLGPVPSFTSAKKKKKADDDDDDDDEDIADKGAPADPHEENGSIVPRDTVRTRGTILITLRNVPPYTLWYVYSHLVRDVIFICVAGMFRAWLKSHHYQHQVVHHPIYPTFNYDLSHSIEVHGVGMSIG